MEETQARSIVWFSNSPDAGQADCICSWCGELITEKDAPPLRVFNFDAGTEARFHGACFTAAQPALQLAQAGEAEPEPGYMPLKQLADLAATKFGRPRLRELVPVVGEGMTIREKDLDIELVDEEQVIEIEKALERLLAWARQLNVADIKPPEELSPDQKTSVDTLLAFAARQALTNVATLLKEEGLVLVKAEVLTEEQAAQSIIDLEELLRQDWEGS
jgi:hypothetical protein